MFYNDEFGVGLIAIVTSLVLWYSYIIYYIIQFKRNRIDAFKKSEFSIAKPSVKLHNYLGLRMSDKADSLQLFKKINLELFIDKKRSFIEFRRFGKFKRLETDQIEYLILEYLTFTNLILNYRGTTYWVINILVKIKNKNPLIRIARIMDKRDNTWHPETENDNDDELYFKTGHELINVLSLTIDKPYKLVDHKK